MQAFTDARVDNTQNELWVVEHPPVYTLGQAGKREHILDAGQIDIVESDRGGQVTYHGPGQVIVYTLINLRRAHMGIRELVIRLEQAVIATLSEFGVGSVGKRDAPGVYVDNRKIAALGLRVRRGCSYHGLSLNVDVDLSPFAGINPCGFKGLKVTSMREAGVEADKSAIVECLLQSLIDQLDHVLVHKAGV